MSSNTDSELDTETSSNSFLGDLGPPIRRYPYKGTRNLRETVEMELSRQQEENEASEWVLFTGVNKQTFSRDFLNSDDRYLERCWNSYDSSQHLLLVIMTFSRAHEVATHVFERILLFSIDPMGLVNCLRSFGSATCKAENGSAKQPDCQFLPKRLPRARTNQWPSVVVETAFSESPSKLISDGRFWLRESNGDVQVVITIKIGRSSPEIVLESWGLVNDRPKRQQVVTISKGKNNNVYIRGQPLTIRFDQLFLRPSSISKEGNINFGQTPLMELAENVWEEQGF
ncbi:uncharacterized protein N7477_006977 [Penicillium maclennaniae]|uniref:uncharacterized protein n=1 Tax=Penicillium maclennaniae TaxID=1343394 RepID=UPI0025411F47|nr:uncharacterized protein N7477_006977 [Penicillium maclennaniae]KAJ5668407.1 hypothetical protein N7477_006977 [Penicillium maclennaniae]